MLLHPTKQLELVMLIEKHPTDNLGKDLLGCAGDACVVEQMTGTVLWLKIKVVGKPTGYWTLQKSTLCLQQLHAAKHAPELVLPAATGGQKLLKNQRTPAYLVLVPSQ